MTEEKRIGRRGAMKRALTVLGAVTVAPTLLAACGSDDDDGGGGGGGLSCTDTSGMEPAAVTAREAQAYTDSSSNAEQNCANCNFYTAGAANACGSCAVVQGPINPEGYCNLWAAAS